uniref:Uncharacterized protein n=1 Tax=Arundo donax TaxID=35708 RepID=A0A0A9BH96_ARUDO
MPECVKLIPFGRNKEQKQLLSGIFR